MLTYLVSAVMAILAPPEVGCEQDQHREYFKATNQHRKRANPGLEIAQAGIIAGWTNGTQARSEIICAGQNRRERGDKIHTADKQHEYKCRDGHEIQKYETKYREDDIVWNQMAADLHRIDCCGMQQFKKFAPGLFEQNQGSYHLDTTAGRA